MYKIIDIEPFFNGTDERSLKLIDLDSFDKTAAVLGHHIPEEITAFIKGLKPERDKIYVHAIAMTACEYYGGNRNADAFRENDLLGTQDDAEASKNPAPYTNVKLQRYKTFLAAHFFKHHVNKDPLKSFGKVVCAAYNMPMHRVELVIEADRTKNPDFARKIEDGIAVALSMGCKVDMDFCSICNKGSRKREEYCFHMKTMPNQILPDGRRVCVYNPRPRFHDISEVLIPADEQAATLSKVASMYSPYETSESEFDMEKLMSEFKSADIDKKITGTTIGDAVKNVNTKIMSDISNGEPDISDKDLCNCANHPLSNILSTLTGMGMVLKPQEHRRILIIKINKDPDFLSKESSVIDIDFTEPSLYNIFKKYAESRSCWTDFLIKRASVLSNKTATEVDTDVISDSLYNMYRSNLEGLDVNKVAATIDKNYNLEGMFKSAVHWSVPTAAAPLAASYLVGAHKEYKRRFEGQPLGPFEKAVAEKPGKVGLGLGALAIGARALAKKYKITKRI